MKYLNKFNNFNNFSKIFEATFTIDKHGIDYIPQSDKGAKSLQKLRLNPSMVFKFTESKPNPEDKVIFIRRSSFSIEVYSDVISKYTKLFHYETGDSKFPFACVPIGEKTDRLVQKEAKGRGASRGDYFRETAFMIILAQRIWQEKETQIPVYGKDGLINIKYIQYQDGSRDSYVIDGNKQRFEDFCTDNDEIRLSYQIQSDTLIEWLGESISNIQGFYKNSTDLILNSEAKKLISSLIKDTNSNPTYKIPKRTALSKWNPSDMWICFKGFENFESVEFWNTPPNGEGERTTAYNNSLEQFNEFFKQSIIQKTGIIGVSLKQQVTPPHYTFPVNLKPSEFSHSLVGLDVKNDIKTAVIHYQYKISGSKPFFGKIELRTFEARINSSLCIEVKGSLTSEHMSGKAGALINYLVPENISKDIEFIRKNSDILKIIEKFMPSLIGATTGKDYEFNDDDLEDVFLQDLEKVKTQQSNSRMQATIFLNWLLSLKQESQNKVVSDIIRFAKSESDWSAAHLIVK